ncbi:10652_t:CDS:1 [Acaulospora colombiana]|uniref:10652_t:CDS:1 n=1 Tax=Acaulospora colombiana TaxID=27376 RepID=A0ACA9K2K3_9GLOM|nr:10652_t:CDS:1 [Acaulospora colombiana]
MAIRRTRQQYARQACTSCRRSKTKCCQASNNEKFCSPGDGPIFACNDFIDQGSLNHLSPSSSDKKTTESYPRDCTRCQKRGIECIYTNTFNKRGPKTKSSKMLVENLIQSTSE